MGNAWPSNLIDPGTFFLCLCASVSDMPSREETVAKHQDTLRSLADDIDRLDVLSNIDYDESEFEDAAAFASYLESWRAHLEETAKVVLRELVRLDPVG